ncbi:MAG: hypothetical protein OEY14_09655, partial [Myxococcales bacterium]|nr:hypothetical protein [Myxococcales bacterium]
MDAASLLRGRSRETAIRRDGGGRWFLGDAPIEHPGVSRSFAGWIDRSEDGRLCLRNAIDWAYIEIEGPPYFVESLWIDAGEVWLRLSGGLEERLLPETLREGEDLSLWCSVREARLAARFENHASVALAPLLDEDAGGAYLRIGGSVIRPPTTA